MSRASSAEVFHLALDLSKASTGWCLTHSRVDHSTQRVNVLHSESGAIKSPSGMSYLSKHLQEVPVQIIRKLEALCASFVQGCKGTPQTEFWVTYEYPIFDAQSTPMQFYIHQSLIAWYEKLGINAVGVSTGMVKSFASSLVGSKVSMKAADKNYMSEVYDVLYQAGTIPEAYKDSFSVNSSDEQDAIFISLLANTSLATVVGFEKQYIPTLLLKTPEFAREAFMANKSGYPICLNKQGTLPLSAIGQEVAKETRKKQVANGHLSLIKSKMFYPYNWLSILSNHLEDRAAKEDRRGLYQEIRPLIEFSAEARDRLLSSGEVKVYCSYTGKLFSHTLYK